MPLIGWHMAANAALAIVMLVEAGFDLDAHRRTRSSATAASTPTSRAAPSASRATAARASTSTTATAPTRSSTTLAAIRRFTTGRVIMVFGADGDRDTTKRAEMGAIAAAGADVVVVTDYHPRFEDPAAIRATLLEGARAAVPDREIHEIADPRAAVPSRRVALAGEGDSILYAGPGHEDYREIAGRAASRTPRRDDARARAARGGLGRMIALTLAEIA